MEYYISLLSLALLLTLTACGASPTETPSPTDPPAPTNTAEPTEIPPTATPQPTATTEPTATPDLPPSNEWLLLSPTRTARFQGSALVLDGLIYVIGGRSNDDTGDHFETYDPSLKKWETLPSLPLGRIYLMAATHEGLIYVFGGYEAQNQRYPEQAESWVYDPATQEWSEIAPMPEQRASAFAVELDGFIYVIGGVGGTNETLRYDPATDSWTSLASLNEPREHFVAVVVDGLIYAVAGRWNFPTSSVEENYHELGSVEVYDPATNTWEIISEIDPVRSGSAVVTLDGLIYVIAGENIDDKENRLYSRVDIFDPVTGEWSEGVPFPEAVHGPQSAVLDGVIYVMGGVSEPLRLALVNKVYAFYPPVE